MAQENNATHWVLGGALLLIGLFVIIALVMVRSQAETVQTTIDNVAPSFVSGGQSLCLGPATTGAEAVTCLSNDVTSVSLNSGTTAQHYLIGRFRDTNGQDDVSSAIGAYYNSNTTYSCTADNNRCYKDAACDVLDHPSVTTDVMVVCDINLEYYTEATDGGADTWEGYMQVTDAGALTADNTGELYSNEVASLTSGSFSNIDFGTLALGATTTSATNQDVEISNLGNTELDYNISLTTSTLSCSTLGTIPVDNIQWNVDEASVAGDLDYDDGDMTDLSTSATSMTLNICPRQDDTGAVGPDNPRGGSSAFTCAFGTDTNADVVYSYWNIEIPSSGVLGTCTGTLTATATT